MNKLDEIREEITYEVIDDFMVSLEDAIDLTFADMVKEGCFYTEMAIAKSVMASFVHNFFELLEDGSDENACCGDCSNYQA